MDAPLEFSAAEAAETELTTLASRLVLTGYTEFLAAFDISRVRPQTPAAHRHAAPPDVRALVNFFYLNQPLRSETLDAALGPCWRALLPLKMAEVSSSGWAQLQGRSLHFYNGILFFADTPRPDPIVYFGDDSIGLLSRIAPLRSDTVLDLCSGSGVLALHSARTAKGVQAVEINPEARDILKINALLNGLGDKVSVAGGSLYDELPSGAKYDLVTANPPLVPFPDGIAYPFVGHGGSDGFIVTRKILNGLTHWLSDSGRAQIIGLAPSDGFELAIEAELRQISAGADLDVLVTIINHIPVTPGSPFRQGLILTAASSSEQSIEEMEAAFGADMRKLSATHLAPYYLHVKRGDGVLRYQNLSRAADRGPWHVLA